MFLPSIIFYMFSWIQKNQLTRGAAILFVTAFASYFLGLVRDRLLAHTFGAGVELDVYNAAFLVPDLLLNIFVAGALQAAFLPILGQVFVQRGKETADRLASTILNTALFTMLILGVVSFMLIPKFSFVLAPGFTAEQKTLLVTLTRLLLLSPLIFAASNTFGAMLVSRKRYLAYGLSPVLYNFGIILGVAVFARWLGIFGVVVGTLLGAVLHLTIRLLDVRSLSFQYRKFLHWQDPAFRKIIELMIPKMIGHPAEQLTFFAFTTVASTLAVGSITMMNFARNFMSVPVSLFGIAFATATFPLLAEARASLQREQFWQYVRDGARKILYFTIPSAVVFALFSSVIVRSFLGSGKFDASAVTGTAMLLSIFALSVPLESIAHLLARSFYALQNTWFPVLCSLIGFGVASGVAAILAKQLGLSSLGWGFFVGSISKVLLLIFVLRYRFHRAFAVATAVDKNGIDTLP
ncbi:MAG: murein biosynthesis integral membrane protein MurJ [Candidatus Kerfeldbacteria bacterium RIFCSPHIGHO2_02_FULL_42_14]|uniref:Murein biosynthesis integral membrane protein MurJ n=1 Tax=Candidatus Kerfeldbacteria bacterium RIFCSPHIGHO2_02_FULL_42_14 TaxID=1798540 RepID=A0A1G2ANS7_9BACT|nr:MAG: murein biosynthesis integral membrane protein MurJ [Candidatus Kerfeldbacteria bacterium RIFCSPHIGHO2_02_FULL_42_14]OGY81184.1 MAG: murein biosynthesis integral membrane protein MurJ [Candidatus Kerfeldbacteria bacterium RIFCSPHIGHO2_12_FULL_42_13]OGY83397.1 MAG: murein biosynthesis integral membrane protein MurJ [Candidatus Kerfeldbacteria bacterium RIFCSPLOWO2_02_FULL_42_19]OGY85480.1 MAG: murein biosynthesis integral membrane protein MurJ [Candidatus Kerfeldbacteria bacterium RIFCSPLO